MPSQFNLKTLIFLGAFFSVVGCHSSRRKNVLPLAENVPGIESQTQPAESRLPETPLPPHVPGENSIKMDEDSIVPVRYSNGRPLIPVEGMIADSGFARIQANASLLQLNSSEKNIEIKKFVEDIVERVNATATIRDVYVAEGVGYFSGWVAVNDYPKLRNIRDLPVDVVMAPRTQSTQRPHNINTPNVNVPLSNPSFAHFSGIERMGVSAFLQTVTRELGEEPTGRRVAVGVTDTGVTYGHPAFRRNHDGKSRVIYMKDFTNEGSGFVFSKAKISIQKMEREERSRAGAMIPVSITAEYIEPAAIENLIQRDSGQNLLSVLADEVFLLPEKLVQLIEIPDTTARLGVISELSFGTPDEKVDLNGNGKSDDLFYFFHIPGTDTRAAKVWIDFSGTGNFRSSKPLEDFNLSGDVVEVMSEKVGLSFSEIELPSRDENNSPIKLDRISVVGFDPGNHGSHVAGIIGAGKTLSNDVTGSLARGVSPEASLMVNRVCSNNGGCNAIKAIIDLAQNGAKIINMSLGGLTSENDGYGIQESIINRLTELYDVLFVISAGNSGPGRQTVGSPSTARHALSVAATATGNMIRRQYNWLGQGAGASRDSESDDDFVMYFSSRGPSAAGGFKPNISAPGTQLSVIQLNAAPGFRAGTDVYWGTSMAAPAAAGAAALLLDAALAYNEKNPSQPLPTDALTLRRILLDSARPFNVSSFNPANGETRSGIYTWIDQGYGMVSLPAAWELLKKKAAVRMSSGVEVKSSLAEKRPLALDYQVRVLRPLGNGKKYDGSISFKTGTLMGEEKSERKFGQGIWLTEKETDKLVEVHFSRQLPLKELSRTDVGDLLRQLNTSSETFELETIYYGSDKAWLKVGVPQSLNCEEDTTPENKQLTLIGSAAIENPPENESGALVPLRASSLFLCLKRKIFSQLRPGDHGAMIRAFRVNGGERDPVAAFELPVYLTVPHHSAALQAKFSIEKQITSFSVDRHYVRVPQGVNVLRVTLEVPTQNNESDAECSGVSLMILKGSNIASSADLAGSRGVAQNCNSTGTQTSKNRLIRFSELNPMAGIWDVHVFGRFQFPLSRYKLEMDYAAFADLAPLNLTPETISSGEFQLVVRESTLDAKPEVSKSSVRMHALLGRTQHKMSAKDGGVTIIPSAGGALARTYNETGVVIISTSSIVSGLDIDLVIDECDEAELKNCKEVASSGGSAAEERAVFMPTQGKFYAVKIDPYEVPQDLSLFSATEEIHVRQPEFGKLNVLNTEDAPGSFQIRYSFDAAQSLLLQNGLFKSGNYEILGDCQLANASGLALVNLPIHVLLK